MIESQAVEHFSHIKIASPVCVLHGFSDLLEHGLVINVALYIRGVLAINKGEIAIGAIIGAAIG